MSLKKYTVSDHDINPNLIDPDALSVIKKLTDAGFTAYLVGGSVRDLLLKRTPKDYDISTSALPEQIKQIFQRRCILIGRRFRLAHVRFGHKIMEVSTFRAGIDESDLIVHDNQWGTPEEDALRRDFTVNGLFYDPLTHEIIDYVGGWEDIHQNLLKTIGHPEVRFKQDPVRMIRLLKFRARFGFAIAPEAKKALVACRQEITKSSQARILEEMLRMLESGAAAPFLNLMLESGLLSLLYPFLNAFIKTETGKEIFLFLTAADKVNQAAAKQKLDRGILLACLLYPHLMREIKREFLDQGKSPHFGEISMLVSSTMKQFLAASFTQFPRRLTVLTHEILTTQFRLVPLGNKKNMPAKFYKYKEFPFSLDFLKLRAMVDKSLIPAYTHSKEAFRQHMHQGERKGSHQHPHPAPRRRRANET